MMTPRPLDLLRARLRAWLRDERGTISIEAIFMLPMLCWCYVGMLLFFDAFRQQYLVKPH